MAKRRQRKIRKKSKPVQIVRDVEVIQRKRQENSILDFYDNNYKKLLFIPFVLVLLAISQIAIQTATTGEFISRGVSLKGGTTITVPTSEAIDTTLFRADIQSTLPNQDIEVRILKTAGIQNAVVVESDITTNDETNELLTAVEKTSGIDRDTYSVDVIGSSLGSSFFKEIVIALIVAFIFMGIVVFLYFRVLVPSAAVILAAFSDMIITVAVVNLMGIKLSTAGIAAFLMLIGYSIDTNILLSTRVIKRKQGTVMDRIIQSLKTGLTMTFSTVAAITVVLLLSKSEVLSQIMTILLIGLITDLVMTWIQNAGLLRMYMERKSGKT